MPEAKKKTAKKQCHKKRREKHNRSKKKLPFRGAVQTILTVRLCSRRRNNQPETIAMYIHDFDIRILLQILTKLRDVHIHASTIEISVTAPDLFQGLFSGEKIVHVFR